MKKILGIFILGTVISACGSSVHRGLVAMKINEEIAHVCVDKNEVQPGDHVVLFRNICSELAAKDPNRISCEKKKIGTGTITELLNEHYAVAKFPSGTGFREGDMVEAVK